MNSIPGMAIAPPFGRGSQRPAATRLPGNLFATAALIMLGACSAPASESGGDTTDARHIYRLGLTVRPDPAAHGAMVELRLQQSSRLLREVRMRNPGSAIRDVAGDGIVSIGDGWITWQPSADGGTLRWFAEINSKRNDNAFDAYIDNDWAVFRAEDIIPRAATRTLKGARSETTLSFQLPPGWSAVTQYFGRDHRFAIDNPERRFDLPSGWIVLGNLGVRNEIIAGIRVKVAGPVGHAVRRMDMLALLQWTLPELSRALPNFPERLTIVAAGDPMWRGGLSAPQSLFIHAARPLLSENGTSTLLHEVAHVGLGLGAGNGGDWIIEGLAEYYSLQALLRSGTISEKRLASALDMQARWGAGVGSLCGEISSGKTTARAVTLLARLDAEIIATSDHRRNLDDVIGALISAGQKLNIHALRDAVRSVTGKHPVTLDDDELPGCETTDAAQRPNRA